MLLSLTMMLLSLNAAGSAHASDCGPPRGFGGEPSTTYRGAYVNRDFCFSVKIPAGLTGHGSGLSERGFGLIVPPDPTGYIYVGADPNSWDAESAEQEARRFIKWTSEESKRLLSTDVTSATLGDLVAARAIIRYQCAGSALTYVREHLVALGPGASTIFSISLYTQESTYEEHRLVLEKLLKTWRFETLPDNPRCAREPGR